jgi:hypothetical protein
MDPAFERQGRRMSSIETSSTPRRPRRRLAAWLAFGAIGLATGAVWASGFMSTTGVFGSAAPADALTKGTPAVSPDTLAGTASEITPLAFNFTGRWGSVADTAMVRVDLSTQAVGTYNVALLLSNTTALTEWASLQLNLEEVVASGGVAPKTCVAGDFTGASNPQVMKFDAVDAGAYWNALDGGHAADVYCFGVHTSAGSDIAGTFLRSAQDAHPTVFPTFLTTVDRAS